MNNAAKDIGAVFIGNLRPADRSRNMQNVPKRSGCKSKFKGAYKKWHGRYESAIWVDGKNKYLGTFDTEAEAALAYNKAALYYHGEFARLNVI